MSESSPELPSLVTAVPGPRSRRLAGELRRCESPNITYVSERFPVFWESASGALVTDVDGNRFLDLTSAFGVAGVGHCSPRVVAAIQRQSGTLIHGMGDVHPSRLKVELQQRLALIAPGSLEQSILGSDGSDAVEAALKTAVIATGNPRVIAFHDAYHGLSYGALDVTDRGHFRDPFQAQLGKFTTHLPYPNRYRPPEGMTSENCGEACLDRVEQAFRSTRSAGSPTGAVIVEPIQGRGGIIVPPDGWFRSLRELCRRYDSLLIADEIFTGCGRTGEWFASEEPPDLLCVGKVLGGGFPISACIGTPKVMGAWEESRGEAIHTSTFLGSPIGCAAALAALDAIQEDRMLERCRSAGERLKTGLLALATRHALIGDVRGRGLMLGIELVHPDGSPAGGAAMEMVQQAMEHGIFLLPAGPHGSVIELTPPYTISDVQVDFALSVMDDLLSGFGKR